MGIKWTEYRVGRRWSFSQSLSFVEPRAHDNVNLSFRCVSKLEAVVSISILTGIDQDPFLGGVPPLSGTDFFTTGKHRRKRPSWVMVLRSWSWAIVRLAKAEFLWVARRHGAEVLGNGCCCGWDRSPRGQGVPPFLWKEEVVDFFSKGKGVKKKEGILQNPRSWIVRLYFPHLGDGFIQLLFSPLAMSILTLLPVGGLQQEFLQDDFSDDQIWYVIYASKGVYIPCMRYDITT